MAAGLALKVIRRRFVMHPGEWKGEEGEAAGRIERISFSMRHDLVALTLGASDWVRGCLFHGVKNPWS